MYGAKLIRHKWEKINSSKLDKRCSLCGVIKYWSDARGRFMFMKGTRIELFRAPSCIYPPNSPVLKP